MIRDVRLDVGWVATAVSAVCALFVAAMGEWSASMTVLLWLLVLDFAAGTLRAAVQGRLSSGESVRKTAVKLALLWILVTFSNQLDGSLGQGHPVRDAVVVFYTVAQGLSVIENVVPIAESVGWRVPAVIRQALEQLGGSNGKAVRRRDDEDAAPQV